MFSTRILHEQPFHFRYHHHHLKHLTSFTCIISTLKNSNLKLGANNAGASVAVECKDGNSKPRFRKEVKTNEHGEFKVQLPFSVSKHVKRIKGCTVKLVSSSEPYCAVASSSSSSSSLRLKSRRQGEHIFSAGFFSFTPLKQPNLCNQKPSIRNSKELGSAFPPISDPAFPPPIQDPSTPGGFLPPLPALPPLPPLPRIPGLPYPPVPGRANKDSSTAKSANKPQFSDRKVVQPDTFPLPPNPFPPNPFLPPPNNPSPNPNPLQPPSSSPFVPSPNPFQPPQSGPFPTIPGLTPSQPPPVFPFPFPPVFPSPSPVTPPASSSMNASP